MRASILFSNDFQPTLAEQSCVYSTTVGPCLISMLVYTIAASHIHYNTSVEMLPSLMHLEPHYNVTHSDGNAFLAVFRLGYSLAESVTEL